MTNGTAYTFTVVATNVYGDSPASGASAAVTPFRLPGAPTGVTGTPGDGQVVVSWNAPADLGSGTLTGYTVMATSQGSGQCVALANESWSVKRAPGATAGCLQSGFCTSVSATSCTVTGLTNGTAYTFVVVVHTTVGDSPASDASAPVTPFALPGAPTTVSGTAGDGQAAVSWSAPSSGGTGGVTGYTVTASPGGATCTAAGSTTSCTMTGLINGTAYTFTVIATNAYGNGPASDASAAVTPFRLPDAPTGVTGTPGDGQVTVVWTAPADPGSGSLTGYTATASPGGATCTSATTSCTVTGLANGTAYTFTVVAHSSVGDSPASAVSAPAIPAVSGAPELPEQKPPAEGDLESSTGDRFTPDSRTTVLTGTGFAPHTPVTIGIYSTPRVLTTVMTDATGSFRVEVAIPADLVGEHTLVAIGLGPDRVVRTLALPITVAADDDGLPVTGAALTAVILAGLGLVVAGGTAVAAIRRRPRRFATGPDDGRTP